MKTTSKRNDAATEALRQAILASDLSQNEIARRAGIDSGMVSRFCTGARGMTLWTAAKVAAVLDLEIIVQPKQQQQKGR